MGPYGHCLLSACSELSPRLILIPFFLLSSSSSSDLSRLKSKPVLGLVARIMQTRGYESSGYHCEAKQIIQCAICD